MEKNAFFWKKQTAEKDILYFCVNKNDFMKHVTKIKPWKALPDVLNVQVNHFQKVPCVFTLLYQMICKKKLQADDSH